MSRVRENRTPGSMGGGRRPAPVGHGRTASGASRLPDQPPRPEIEKLLGRKVFLQLVVKVRPKWRRDEKTLERLGL